MLDAPLGAGAVTEVPLGAGAVTEAPALGVAGDGVIVADGVAGAGAVTDAPGAVVLSLGFAGSAMLPFDVLVVVPLTPALLAVSAGVAFFDVSGCVVCCAAAGSYSAASSTAANAYRCVMVELSCIMMCEGAPPAFDGQHADHRTYHAPAPQNRDISERKLRTVTEATITPCDVSRAARRARLRDRERSARASPETPRSPRRRQPW
jgi:hypothetical protein